MLKSMSLYIHMIRYDYLSRLPRVGRVICRYARNEIVMSLNFPGCRAAIIPIRDEEPTTTGEGWRNNLRAFSCDEYARLLACARHVRVLYSTDTLGTA